MITHIYFDWSGTLAYSGSKSTFISGSKNQKLSTLYPDTIPVLRVLRQRGYTLGLITNTSKSPELFRKSLKVIGIDMLFNGAIILSNDPHMCKKPCKCIFNEALRSDHTLPNSALMVGDKLSTDIKGAKSAGMKTYYLCRHAHDTLLYLLDHLPRLSATTL
jgi:HAD superfamily hydrolase (TIGR01662 family)